MMTPKKILMFPCKKSEVPMDKQGYHPLNKKETGFSFEHRKVFAEAHPEIELTKKDIVLFHCGNKWCVEKSHLFLATEDDKTWNFGKKS